jgi:hypothetical protein
MIEIEKEHFEGLRQLLHLEEVHHLETVATLLINDEDEEYQLLDEDFKVLMKVDF